MLSAQPSSGLVGSKVQNTMTLRLIGGQEEPRVRKLRLPATAGRISTDRNHSPAANNAVFRSEYLSRKHAEFFCDPTGQVLDLIL
jgi:pSer/pThr/pTyr-binding forkhead associated (FHA) protein